MTRPEPPNLRAADTCTSCKHGRADWDGDAECKKYDCYNGWDQICDEFERMEDE
jgi:hypothetical protein